MSKYLKKIPLINRLYKEQKIEEKKPKDKKLPCNCEGCRFSAELDDKITDKSLREKISALDVFPSFIKDVNPNEKFKEAEELEKEGKISEAANRYGIAARAALYKRSENCQSFWVGYENFLSKYSSFSNIHSREIKAYKELNQRPDREDIMKIMISTYEKIITAAVEKK